MKHICLFFILICVSFFSSLCHAQTDWQVISTSSIGLADILFTSQDTGFIIGYNATAKRTFDGGKTWNQMNLPPEVTAAQSSLYSLSFPTKTVGYIGGSILGRTLLLRTTNGGDDWIHLPLDSDSYINYIDFPSPAVGYLTGGPGTKHGFLGKSIDSGKTWRFPLVTDDIGYKNIKFRDELHGMFSNMCCEPRGYGLFRTSDGMATWEKVKPKCNFDIGCADLGGITHIDGQRWVVGNDVGISLSTDDGLTWRLIASRGGGQIRAGGLFFAFAFHQNTGYALADLRQTRIYKTTDGGLTWGEQAVHDTTYLSVVSAPTDSVAYVLAAYAQSGSSGWLILKTTNGGGKTVYNPPFSVPTTKDAEQLDFTITPNPSQGNVTIQILQPTNAGKLEIIDVLGKAIDRVMIPPNTTSYTLDIRRYPAGAYYVRIGSKTSRFVKM